MINEQGLTILDLFQISGFKIRRLLDEVMQPGTHEVMIDMRDLPVGMYIVRVQVGDIVITRKLVKI